MKTSEERILRVLPFVAIAALAATSATAMPTLPGIGFELTLRQAVTNSPQSKVTSSEMKSFSVDEKDGRTSLVWRGRGQEWDSRDTLHGGPQRHGRVLVHGPAR